MTPETLYIDVLETETRRFQIPLDVPEIPPGPCGGCENKSVCVNTGQACGEFLLFIDEANPSNRMTSRRNTREPSRFAYLMAFPFDVTQDDIEMLLGVGRRYWSFELREAVDEFQGKKH